MFSYKNELLTTKFRWIFCGLVFYYWSWFRGRLISYITHETNSLIEDI
jgi:hypothetical protein